MKWLRGVQGVVLVILWDNDSISSKETVAFVPGEKERVIIWSHLNR